MCYHWDLGIGHLYAHHSALTSTCIPDNRDTNTQGNGSADLKPSELWPSHDNTHVDVEGHDTDGESDNAEFSLDDCDPEGWQDVETDGSEDDGNGDCDMDFESKSEEDFVGM